MMMNQIDKKKTRRYLYYITGFGFITLGILLFINLPRNYYGIYVLLTFVISGVYFFEGAYRRIKKLLTVSIILLVVGGAIFILFSNNNAGYEIGLISLLIAFGFAILFASFYIYFHKVVFWFFNPIILFFFIGISFLINNYSFLHFTFFIGLGIGIALLGSGLYWKLFGLIIPACLLIGVTPGLYFAWGINNVENELVNTGVFLVSFALGWGLITAFSKVQTQNFLWWPLIPGGILAMVGWGLYIGGSPKDAVGFIGNTGSIGLIIFGIYILLMKRGIQR